MPRRYLHRIGAAAIALGAYPAYQAMIGHSVDIVLLLAAIELVGAFANGTFGALLTDLFPTEVRFSGVALAYNIAAAIFAGLSALITTWLLVGHRRPGIARAVPRRRRRLRLPRRAVPSALRRESELARTPFPSGGRPDQILGNPPRIDPAGPAPIRAHGP